MNAEELQAMVRSLQLKLICEKAESQSRERKLKAQLEESKTENEKLQDLLAQKASRKRRACEETEEEKPCSKKPKMRIEEAKDCAVLECTICMFSYDSDYHFPHILDCGHSLCKTCLHILEDQDVKKYGQQLEFRCIKCPSCKTSAYRRLNEDFLKNYALVPHPV